MNDFKNRFPNEEAWLAECMRVVTMMGDLLTIGSDPISIPKKDVETLMYLVAGLVLQVANDESE